MASHIQTDNPVAVIKDYFKPLDGAAATILVSGGSVLRIIEEAVTGMRGEHWRVFLADERCEQAYSNFEGVRKAFQGAGAAVFPWVRNLPSKEASAGHSHDCCYEFPFHEVNRLPAGAPLDSSSSLSFDLAILGIGPDGHICSLWPGSPAVSSESLTAATTAPSPMPSPARVSVTPALLRKVLSLVFLVPLKQGCAQEVTDPHPLLAAQLPRYSVVIEKMKK